MAKPDKHLVRVAQVEGASANDRVLLCDAGSLREVLSCAAPDTCADLEGHTSVHCGSPDTAVPYAIEGDPCFPPSAAACPLDRARLLVCKDGAWTTAQSCASGLTCRRTMAGTQGAGWSCPLGSANGCVVCEP